MSQMLMVAKRTGRTLDHVLNVLRDIDSPAYKTLAQKLRHYASCVGLVDTGYFRKRGTEQAGLAEEKRDHAHALNLAESQLEDVDELLSKVKSMKKMIEAVREHLR